ncbi:MAG TPA: hypothetical protein ENJ41_01940, partial [Oceanospirillales bacterium]|nr:hypothetical protein [Oceanospirillales bacterium]
MKNHIVTLLILVAGYSFSMDAEQFFKTDDVKQFEMNSNGSMIATIKSMGQGQSIVLTNLYSLKTNIIYADNQIKNSNIEYIHWIDKDTLIVGISSNNLVAILVINLFFEQNEFKSTDQIFLPKYGYVKDPLIKEDNTFLFVALQPNNSDVQGLYKVN